MSPLAGQVFHCTELCEMILLNLDVRSLLITRKASQIFEQTISTSLKLRRALFLEADDTITRHDEMKFNPLVAQTLNELGYAVSWEVFDPNSKVEQERNGYTIHPPMALLDLYAVLTIRYAGGPRGVNPYVLVSKAMVENLVGGMLISQPPVRVEAIVRNDKTEFLVRARGHGKDERMRAFMNGLLWLLN